MLRGGAFKPRTSPYSFQGLGEEGIRLLVLAKKETGLPIVTELVSVRHLDLFDDVDMIQIGARNMYNYEMLKEVGRSGKPVLLKRGLTATIEEFLMSAEYMIAEGNSNIVLCERGIRSYDNSTRNVLDLAAVALLKEKTHLPVIVDPSHGTGRRELVGTMAHAALATGADGIAIEVHNDPEAALSDGPQSLDLDAFDDLMMGLRKRIELERRLLSDISVRSNIRLLG
jgi:3-deoxy-7-phosphoheptulonate synthase